MDTHRILKTFGDPLEAIRGFLKSLYVQAGLDGMILPAYRPGRGSNQAQLVTSERGLSIADPFIPLTSDNTARRIRSAARLNPGARFAAVLRSCEIRALKEILRREELPIDRWLLIGVDCLAVYPAGDFAWRAEKAGGPEGLTHKTLRSARQGGLAPYRFRESCQICAHSWAEYADVNIGILGLPIKQHLLIAARDTQTAVDLELSRLTHKRAPEDVIDRRRRVIARIRGVRDRTRARVTRALGDDLPASVSGVMALLEDCYPCRSCLETCPIIDGSPLLNRSDGGIAYPAAVSWLGACVSCGICEDACPEHKPLTAVFGRIKRRLDEAAAAAL